MQAAPGTPLGRETRLPLLFAAVAATLYALDQVTKLLAVEHLSDRSDDVRVVGDVLTLNLVYNPGAAFSTGTGLTPVISAVAIIATVVVLWYSRKVGTRLWAVALGFLLAGITGNLTDRLLREPGPMRGHVVDMLQLPSWPVFNVADICINVAAGLIILQAFRGIHLDGTRDGDRTQEAGGTEEAGDRDDIDDIDNTGDARTEEKAE
jgi:signal peptidase II